MEVEVGRRRALSPHPRAGPRPRAPGRHPYLRAAGRGGAVQVLHPDRQWPADPQRGGDRTGRATMPWPMWPARRWATAISTMTTPCSSPMPAERCESRQVFKKVLRNGAIGVFQGKILVKPGRAEDRRLPDQPGAAAGRGQPVPGQAGAGNLRRRREVQPRLDLGRHRRDGAVLPAIARGAAAGGAIAAGAGLSGRSDRRDRG